ncbi:C2 domain [Plasmopara halstedii]|uniref:C2 domain n=1 Tax=Plasmopara halstedii TaxID=4781 RepID=A0A0P1AP92_PLAHL|nr:C2 domain [Plasmopara halstedii]CEG42992.1 C2 domain [Plasmopara halstedii]|eukprot:XP_024579361.1 C2 domain [Plasmopara halstedii]
MSLSFSLLDNPAAAVYNVGLEIVSAQDIQQSEYLNLAAGVKGKFFSSDAYTKIEINGMPMAWSHPVFDSVNPQWNEKFFFNNVPEDSTFRLIVLGTDMDEGDELGEAQFNTANAKFDPDEMIPLPITLGDRNAGVISIKVNRQQLNADSNAAIEEVGPVRYSVHSSYTAGVLKKLTSDDEDWKSLAYIVQLHNVPLYLPDDNEWNKNYTKIQRVFASDHPEAPILRGLVKTQHAVVYKHEKKSTKYGYLTSPDDFFHLIRNGMRRGKPVLFTYAITPKGWLFSETGAGFFKDMLSKHMMHSNTAESVKYAGEFRIEEEDDGTSKLVIDNNSGTYAPSPKRLPQLKLLIENNFPGIKCEALDRENKESVKRRKEILDAWD